MTVFLIFLSLYLFTCRELRNSARSLSTLFQQCAVSLTQKDYEGCLDKLTNLEKSHNKVSALMSIIYGESRLSRPEISIATIKSLINDRCYAQALVAIRQTQSLLGRVCGNDRLTAEAVPENR